ncbi:taste receptor type 1 member 1-like [Aplochiton taeniatus]
MDLYMFLLLPSLLNQLFNPGSSLVLSNGKGTDSVGPDCSSELDNIGPTQACPGCLSEFSLEGDYVLGGLFQLHECGTASINPENYPYALPCYRLTFSPAGYQQVQVMRFAVEMINNSSSLLPGVRLGYRLLDYCHPTHSFSAALDLLTQPKQKAAAVPVWNGAPHRPGVISVTGPFGSSATISVAPLFMQSLIPMVRTNRIMVTHGASSVKLSYKTRYPSFFRTIPSDVNQVQAIIALLQKFAWNWVAFLGSNDDYSRDAMSLFQEKAWAANICLAYQDTITSDTSSFPNIFKTLRSLNVHVVVFFANVELVIPFMTAAVAEKVVEGEGARVWIASETWSQNQELLGLPGMQSIVVLGVSLQMHNALDGLGEFVTSLIHWFDGSNKAPVLQCSLECRPGFKRVPSDFHACCYSCVICPQGTYINSTADLYSCLPCLDSEWSLNGSTSCVQRTVVYLGLFNLLGILLLLLASILLLITVATLGLFLWQRATPVVRSAGGPLCYFMLVCLSLSAATVLLQLGVPTPLICFLRYPSFIVLYGAVLSCLTVRSFQIISIFKMATKLQGAHAYWVRYQGQWVAVAGSTGLLLLLCVVWLGVDGPKPVKYPLLSTVVLDCSFGSLTTFSLPILLVALLSVACFLLSYLGTDLPAGYNEARSISLSLLLFFLSWTLALTVQLSSSQTHLLSVNAFAMLSSLFGIQVGYFMPKCYIIIVRPERNTAAYFQSAIQNYNLQTR